MTNQHTVKANKVDMWRQLLLIMKMTSGMWAIVTGVDALFSKHFYILTSAQELPDIVAKNHTNDSSTSHRIEIYCELIAFRNAEMSFLLMLQRTLFRGAWILLKWFFTQRNINWFRMTHIQIFPCLLMDS